jgi:hypothetical protein
MRTIMKRIIWGVTVLTLTGIALGTLTHCQTIQNLWILRSGKVGKVEFSRTLDYAYAMGMIIVKPVINGQTYRFILNSGSPVCALTSSIAEILGVEQESTIEANAKWASQ